MKLIAISQCIMEEEEIPTLSIGKEYVVEIEDDTSITIIDDEYEFHTFTKDKLHKFFKL